MALADYYYRDLYNLVSSVTSQTGKTSSFKILQKKLVPVGRRKTYDYLLLKNVVGDLEDIQESFSQLHQYCHNQTRVVVIYYNHLWEPVLKLASWLHLRDVQHEQNWLNGESIAHLLSLSGFDVICQRRRLLFPVSVPILSDLINTWLKNLPFVDALCLTVCVVARPRIAQRREHTVSIVIPAINESGTISKNLSQIPRFGS